MRTDTTTIAEDRPTAALPGESAAQTVDAPVAELRRKPAIDKNLVVDGLLFATPGHRCSYLGTSNREKPRWLEENKGGYRRLEDVLQGSAQPRQPDNSGVAVTGPNGETSSRNIRKDDGDNDNVSLIGTPPEYSSPSCQPTYRPAPPVNEKIPNGSTQTKLWPHAEAATETTKPKTQTKPLGSSGHKQGERDSHQGDEQKPPAQISKSWRKLSPELMRVVLEALNEVPILSYAASKAGIHAKTLPYWLKRSKAGDDGYDIEWDGLEWRFHELCNVMIDGAFQQLVDKMLQVAMGVTVKTDESGNCIVEACGKPNMKMMRAYLELMRPETWAKPRKNNLPRTGGVLVIGGVAKKPKSNTVASVKARTWKSYSRKLREAQA